MPMGSGEKLIVSRSRPPGPRRGRLVWTPHGMLRPWAMAHKRWKKRLAWWLFQRRHFTVAQLLQATCEEEAGELAEWLPDATVEVVPIGIDLPEKVIGLETKSVEPREDAYSWGVCIQ